MDFQIFKMRSESKEKHEEKVYVYDLIAFAMQ